MPVITKENIVVEAEKFRSSKQFASYMAQFMVSFDVVFNRVGIKLDEPITTQEQAEKFAKFCQLLWEDLPDSPSIRTGAFFTLCDFAEYHCYGDQVSPGEDEDGSVEPYCVG